MKSRATTAPPRRDAASRGETLAPQVPGQSVSLEAPLGRATPTTSVPTPRATRQLEPALFGLTLVVADAVALVAGLFAAYWIRFGTGWLSTPLGTPTFGPYAATIPVILPLGLFVFHQLGLYRRRRSTGLLRDLAHGVKAVALLAVLLATVAFFYREFSFSRVFLVLYAVSTVALFVGSRRLASLVHRGLRARNIGVERVAIAGDSEAADELAKKILGGAGTGLRLVARLSDEWAQESPEVERPLRPLRVRSFLKAHRVDRLIVTDATLTSDERLDLVEVCHAHGARCDFVPDLFELMLGRARLEEIDGMPLVGTRLHPLGRIDRVQKRILDVVGSALGLVVLMPLLAALGLAVRLDSAGPAFYRQRRIGRDGREFDLWKFRSMPTDAENSTGPIRTGRGDVRATRMGRVLRRTSLDELPQLWNVLRGEMSLVGPRPERPFFVESFREAIPRYMERQGVKSGLTGWAQVNGLRGDSSIEDRTRFDIWYVENWSLALDLKIVVLTAFRFLFQEEAY